MTFISIKQLQEGMVLERDVYFFDARTSRLAMLRSGGVLTQSYINRMRELGILGVYIQTEKDEIDSENKFSRVPPALKEEALNGVRSAFEMLERTTVETIHVSSINQTVDISRKLVDTLVSESKILVNIADLRVYDDYTYNHSLGVTILSIAIGLSLGFNRKDLYDLALCALLHDIGKITIPIEIISKPARLTTDEFEVVKRHAANGAQFLLKSNLVSKKICGGVLSHHERYDGTGYPNRLSGENIPLFGRIICVADVYDALTSVRPYREPSSPPEAIEYIMGGSGKLFDICVVNAFLTKISPYPVGSCVKLSNGKMAIVVKQNEYNPLRPVVQLFEQIKTPLDLYRQRELQNIVINGICTVDTDEII